MARASTGRGKASASRSLGDNPRKKGKRLPEELKKSYPKNSQSHKKRV